MTYIKHNKLSFGKKSDDIKKNMDDLFRFIYHAFSLDHDKMKPMYDHIKLTNSHDRPFKSYEYEDGMYYYDYNGDDTRPNDDYNNESFVQQIADYLSHKSPTELKIRGITDVFINNISGLNEDTRGTKYLDWRLHFWEEYEVNNPEGITLHDLIIILYKIKSHKFEYWYELFTCVKEVLIEDGCIRADLEFDHGS